MVETLDPTGDVPGIVDYERPDTWPLALTALFDAQAKVLEDYAREEHRIMFLNFEARWRARNEYRDIEIGAYR